jgi:copper chaperone CopZ
MRALGLYFLSFGTLSFGTLSLGTGCTSAPAEATTELQIGGMVCESCSQAITAALRKQDGVVAAEVDHVSGKAVIRHDPARIDRAGLAAAVTALGYTVAP